MNVITVPEFLLTEDRAGHAVVERISPQGDVLHTVDFGTRSMEAQSVLAFLDLTAPEQDALAVAVSTWLICLFPALQADQEAADEYQTTH